MFIIEDMETSVEIRFHKPFARLAYTKEHNGTGKKSDTAYLVGSRVTCNLLATGGAWMSCVLSLTLLTATPGDRQSVDVVPTVAYLADSHT